MNDMVHRIEVKGTGQEGLWELSCPHCDFEALYRREPVSGEYVVHIIRRGERNVAHASAELERIARRGQRQEPRTRTETKSPARETSLENWLTPHLREQIAEVLEPLDF